MTRAVSPAPPEPPAPPDAPPSADGDVALRIGDAASAAGVSPRTLRYWEELGLVSPSEHTPGGERRYRSAEMAQLERIIELREVLGLTLEDIRTVLSTETRLDELRAAYRASEGVRAGEGAARQGAILQEALELNESLAAQIDRKLERIDVFRAKLSRDAARCRELLDELATARSEGAEGQSPSRTSAS